VGKIKKSTPKSLSTVDDAPPESTVSLLEQILREDPNGLSASRLQQSISYINAYLGEDLSLATIAAHVGMSQYYFCRLFRQSMGIAPHQYLIQQRLERSKLLLQHKEYRIIDIAAECGFANPSHFARCFRKATGISPHQFRLINN
jgi:AraC family transcriptional regulator